MKDKWNHKKARNGGEKSQGGTYRKCYSKMAEINSYIIIRGNGFNISVRHMTVSLVS